MNNKLLFALVMFSCLWTAGAHAAEAYRLGSGDVVRISVYEQPDLNTVARIAESGSITFPLIGELKLKGLTEREAELQLAALLEKQQIVRSPQVSIIVDAYESQRVSVLGQVAKPGIYPISRGSTVIDLIAQAGGLSETAAEQAVITNVSGGSNNRKVVDLGTLFEGGSDAQALTVADGDRIFVPRMERFYIYGQVNNPGTYRLERGMTVMQAVSVAGGLTTRATERGLTIRRQGTDGREVVSIDARLTDRLQASDVVHVEESLF